MFLFQTHPPADVPPFKKKLFFLPLIHSLFVHLPVGLAEKSLDLICHHLLPVVPGQQKTKVKPCVEHFTSGRDEMIKAQQRLP